MKLTRFIIALAALLILPAAAADAADWYVSGYATWGAANPAGSDAADGASASTPKATFASMDSLMSAGDTVWVAGIHFSAPANPFSIASKNNISVRQWPGMAQAHIHGGVRAAMTGWTQSTNRYNITIGAGKTIGGVTWNYHTSQDADGMRRAWLKKVADAATCSSTAWSWFYDSVPGVLYINANGGSPNSGSDVVTYHELGGTTATSSNLNGVYFQNCSGIVIDGPEISGFIGTIDSTDWYVNSVHMNGCTNSVVSNLTSWDSGNHSVVFAGAACTNNAMLNVAAYGINGHQGTANDGSNHFVFYSGNTDVTGSRGVRVVAVCSHLKDPTGAELNSLSNTGGFYAHTSITDNFGAGSTPIYVRDILWDQCTLRALDESCDPGIGGDNQPNPPTATPEVWSSYPIRVSDMRVSGARITVPTPIAFTRSRFDMTAVAADSGDCTISTGAGVSGYSLRLFTSCDLIMHTGGLADQTIFATANNWVDRFINCSWLMDRTGSTNFRYFIKWNFSTTGTVIARNNVFADNNPTGTTYLCVGDDSTAADKRPFRHNSYFGIDTYSTNTSLDTKPEWLASCDTAAVDDAATSKRHFPAALPYRDSDGPLLDLAGSSPLRTWRAPYGSLRPVGINKRAWSGHVGAWQYPAAEPR